MRGFVAAFDRFKNKYQLTLYDLILIVLVFALKYAYFWMQTVKTAGAHMDLPIDNYLPFIPVFVVPYLFYNVFLLLALVLVWNKPARRKALLTSYAIVQMLSLSTFFFYQTAMNRPDFVIAGFFTYIVAFIYAGDASLNCFPSLHAGLVTCALYFNRERGVIWWVIGLLIIVSTVFVKQHYFLDIIGGVVFAVISIVLAILVVRKYLKYRNYKSSLEL